MTPRPGTACPVSAPPRRREVGTTGRHGSPRAAALGGLVALAVALVLPVTLAVGVATVSPAGATDRPAPGERTPLRPRTAPVSAPAPASGSAATAGTGTSGG